MKIFSPTHFLRHVSKPALHGFTQAHPIFPRLTIDWECSENSLADNVHAAIEVLQTSLLTTDLPEKEKSAIADDLNLWHDDLRRVHLLTNDLAVNEFHLSCANDTEALTAFNGRDTREKALWDVGRARDF